MTGFTAKDYAEFKLVVYANVRQSMVAIIRAMQNLLAISFNSCELEVRPS